MTRKQRTEEELRKASDHLCYEFWMFTNLARVLGAGISGEQVIKNAALESFTIHARILLDFLYPREDRPPHPDDVIAADFFDDPATWTDNRPEKSARVKDVHKRVGKEIAHLSYCRQEVTPETKPWYFAAIAEEVDKVVKTFLSLVPFELLDERWEEYKKARREGKT